MNLQALGYVGIRTRKLDDWNAYATRFLGLQLVDQSRNALAYRMDDRKQRVVIEQGFAAGHQRIETHVDPDDEAAQLYVTPKTVEATLSRVYRKVGVRSRTELARRFAGDAATTESVG